MSRYIYISEEYYESNEVLIKHGWIHKANGKTPWGHDLQSNDSLDAYVMGISI
jgi:hypothetical protein